MSQPETRNPEHRSSSPMILFCTGAGLCTLAYFLGVGTIIGAAFTGGDPAIVAGGLLAAIGLGLSVVVGVLLMAIGGIQASLVPDAHLAALAMEHGLTLCSTDGDFARFAGLRWENPLALPGQVRERKARYRSTRRR